MCRLILAARASGGSVKMRMTTVKKKNAESYNKTNRISKSKRGENKDEEKGRKNYKDRFKLRKIKFNNGQNSFVFDF